MSDHCKLPGYPGTARANAPLAPYTTWRIGGEAEWLVEPDTEEEFLAAFATARDLGRPFTVIGRGSNVLIDDRGIPGVVALLRRGFDRLSFEEGNCRCRAEAGCPMPRIASSAEKRGIEGLTFLIGIPGAIGAGVAINAGTGGVQGPSMNDVLVSARLLDTATGEIVELKRDDLGLAYRHSNIPERKLWVLSVVLEGQPARDRAALAALAREILAKRAANQPLSKFVSGSVFKPPVGGRPPGWYIDQAGLKGLRVGGAVVSQKHANWIENDGTASSEDVRKLMAKVQRQVHDCFGVWMEREVRFLPDDGYGVSPAMSNPDASRRAND